MKLEFGNPEQIKLVNLPMEIDPESFPTALLYPIGQLITNIPTPEAHKQIAQIKIPDCLKRPLTFGDAEQISALEKIANEADNIGCYGPVRDFTVTIRFHGELEEQIKAHSMEEAEKIADELCNDLDLTFADVEVDNVDVDE